MYISIAVLGHGPMVTMDMQSQISDRYVSLSMISVLEFPEDGLGGSKQRDKSVHSP